MVLPVEDRRRRIHVVGCRLQIMMFLIQRNIMIIIQLFFLVEDHY